MSEDPELDLTHIEVISHLRASEHRADAQRLAWRAGLGRPRIAAAAPTLIFSHRRPSPATSAPPGALRVAPTLASVVAPSLRPDANPAPWPRQSVPSIFIFVAVLVFTFALVVVFGMIVLAGLGLVQPFAAALLGLGGLLVAFGVVTLSATLLLPAWAQARGGRG